MIQGILMIIIRDVIGSGMGGSIGVVGQGPQGEVMTVDTMKEIHAHRDDNNITIIHLQG